MANKLNLIALLLVIFAVGCSNNEDVDFGKEVELTEVLNQYLSGMGKEGISREGIIFNTIAEWNSFLAQLNCCEGMEFNTTILEILEDQNIDFNSYSVVAVFDAPLPISGVTINITKIREYQNELLVEFKRSRLNSSMSIRQPFHMVKIKKSKKSAVFKDLDQSDT